MVDSDSFNLEDHLIPNFFSSEKAEEITHKMNALNQKERDTTNKIIMSALSHMKREEEIISQQSTTKMRKKSLNNGSLYKMFISDVFGMEMVIIYLDIKNESGILDTLVNLMYNKYIHQSLFYLPQLCVMLNYKSYTESLEGYLLDRCINQMKFSLQVTWLVNSYSEDEGMKKEVYDILLQKIEETLVNGNRSSLTQYLQYRKMENRNSVNSNDSQDIYKSSVKKEIRLQYFNVCIDFYQKLKLMCEDLKNYPKDKNPKDNVMCRKEALKNYISKFNNDFKNQRIENKEILQDNPFFNGIILPFDDSISTNDNDNSLIVRLIPEQSFCFSTKARVPTKICAECVKVIECSKWNTLYLNDENIKTEEEKEVDEFTIINKEDILSLSSLQDKQLNENQLKEFYDKLSGNQKEEIEKTLLNLAKGHHQKEPSVSTTGAGEININDELQHIFGKPIIETTNEIKSSSPFRNFITYQIKNFIAKANDDLRQELLSMQMIKQFDEIFKNANIPLRLHPYEILITSSSSGLLEFLSNTSSIDGIKKSLAKTKNKSLNYFYRKFYENNFVEAQRNFVESLAAYSLVCYYLQLKDRHNGNILIDMYGNIIHIDFGFILGISPGNINFESAPFKLTQEYIEIMDGEQSEMFKYFRNLLIKGMIESKKHVESFVKIVEIMSHGSKMPCFDNKDIGGIISKLRERFGEAKNDTEFPKIVDDLIYKSKDNFWTNKYDYFQKITNGIIP